MSFHFKKTELPAKALRRVCHERINAALEGLRKRDHPDAVHGVRKEIKRLRALFRLVREEISQDAYRKGARALRKAAGSLTAPRDARVKLKVFQKLVGRSARRFAGIEKALRRNSRRQTRRFLKKDSAATAGRILRRTDKRVAGLKISAVGWAVIEPGLKQSYQRGREFYELARTKPSQENLHEWRKHVKNLWYYFRLLRPAWPAQTRAMMDDLKSLGEQLGDDHDLALLQEFVAESRPDHPGEAGELSPLIKSRQKERRTTALKLGARLYAETSASLCLRLGTYWKDWRNEADEK